MNKVTLLKGDCLQKLKELEDNSIDSVVTDPPYEIGFMGKGWDDSGIANNPELWKEVLRVLKPGGHLLSFSHSRTYHRQAVAVEDAGFEIRDQIMWIYGSGFPKSHNIGKAVDKLEGNASKIKGYVPRYPEGTRGEKKTGDSSWFGGDGYDTHPGMKPVYEINNQYEGWGTALKPAHEPIVMARKPFKGTVADNVLEWGTGGINVDGCRIGYEDTPNPATNPKYRHEQNYKMPEKGQESKGSVSFSSSNNDVNTEGRFPANIIFDEEAGKILDEQSGKSKSSPNKWEGDNNAAIYGKYEKGVRQSTFSDEGGASRFFYCPKASKKDRNEGCDELEEKQTPITNMTGLGRETTIEKRKNDNGFNAPKSKNTHPTVKPTDLMAYLIRLITPKGGVVLDPFMGSGSTGKAAVREGMNFIGIEREDEYMEIAKTRIEHEQKKNKHTQFFDI